jgi:hypothetical protein
VLALPYKAAQLGRPALCGDGGRGTMGRSECRESCRAGSRVRDAEVCRKGRA